jgi:7-cyano-7-deazaguanine reductase
MIDAFMQNNSKPKTDLPHPHTENTTSTLGALGEKTTYESQYNPTLLFPIARAPKRAEIGIHSTDLPFYGVDLWNNYEVSWLNPKGKPEVAVAEMMIDCRSPVVIESKSMKLYFNSFNNTHFENAAAVIRCIRTDLTHAMGDFIQDLRLLPLQDETTPLLGTLIDALDIECSVYLPKPELLTIHPNVMVTEVLCSHLLKSNCLVTQQPDWCSVQISYTGPQIDHANLLRYIVSFRNANEFHEQCIEKMFMHLLQFCKPSALTVYGRSTRRGGIDINSLRSTTPLTHFPDNTKLMRQ